MADTSLDDGDMARLLARTADMLKQVCDGSAAEHMHMYKRSHRHTVARSLASRSHLTRCHLTQLTFLEEQLPYLIPTARAALRGMDRKPISDLVT
jgi:hypothetical protein